MEKKENNDRRGLGLRKGQSSQKAPPKGKSWFFGIGINNYNEFTNLNNAVNDIESIQNLLVDKYDIESDCTITILNENATRENIIDQLDVLVKKIEAEDKLIIYYSGHGHLDKNTDRGYWIPHDAQPGKTANYIRNSTIREFVKDLKARHVLLISDSCFSGTLFVRGANRSTAAVDELETIPSRWAICSGRHDEEVYDGNPGENSPFAKSILETLSNNYKPVFNVVKLADRVVEQTRSNYQQLPEGNPLFGVGHKGGQYIFHLKKDEVADWKECVGKGTIAAYNAFLVKYPDGKYTSDARAGLKSIKATELWKQIEQAKEGNLIETNEKLKLINQYVDEFENQSDYEKVLDLGQLLDYKKKSFQAQSSEFALRKFLRRSVPNVGGASEIFANAKQKLQQTDAASTLKRKEEEERLAESKRIRLEKEAQLAKQQGIEKEQKSQEEQLAKQNKEAEQRLKEQNRLAEEERKAKQQKEEALKLQQTVLKQKQNIKQPVPTKEPPSQAKKYGLFAGLSILGLIIVIFIIRFITGGQCSSPVEIFVDSDIGKVGLKQCNNIILPPTYNFIYNFIDGLALVEKDNLFGFIDEKGKLIIETKYEKAESFSYGKALVRIDGNEFHINKAGYCIENCPDEKTTEEVNNLNEERIENKNAIEAEKKYNDLINRANVIFEKAKPLYEKKSFEAAKLNYEKALEYYQKAKVLVKDNLKAVEGIRKCDRILYLIDDEIAWAKAIKTNSIDSYRTYLVNFSNGMYQKNAKERITKLNTPKYVTDKRSGYKTVNINRKTWLAENLNLKIDNSPCYENKDANCDKFGRLYTWKAAKKACRALGSGWRLPKKHEWNELIEDYFKTLKSKGETDFKFQPGGKRTINGIFSELGSKGYYWHAALDGSDNVFLFEFSRDRVKSRGDSNLDKNIAFSCRCIKD